MDESPLPHGWAWTTLAEVSDVILGQSPPSSTYNLKAIGLPFFQGKAEFGDLYPTPVKWCSEPKKIAEAYDVLISVRAPVGPTNLCQERSCIGRGLAAIRPEAGMPSRYFLYYLRHIEYEWGSKATGTTFKAISGDTLKRQCLPLAPVPEQHRIVAEIETQFTRLDAGIAALKRAQANLRRYKASVLKAACEGRLVPTEAELTAVGADGVRPPYEPASALLERILTERRAKWEETQWVKQVDRAKQKAAKAQRRAAGRPLRRGERLSPQEWQDTPEAEYARYLPKDDKWKAKYKEPAPPDTTDLPDLPEGWVWATVEQTAEHRLGKMLDRAKNRGAPRPYLRNINVRWFGFDLSDVQIMRVMDEELGNVSVRDGDLVVCEGGEPGRAAVWERPGEPMVIQKALHRVRPATGISAHYLAYRLAADALTGRLETYFTGSTIEHFTGQSLASYTYLLPPTVEQIRIVAEVERRLSVVQELEAAIEANLKRAERLRRAILKRALEGKLVPQDPNDEPANVLLEHIQRQRNAVDGAGTYTSNAKAPKNPTQLPLDLKVIAS